MCFITLVQVFSVMVYNLQRNHVGVGYLDTIENFILFYKYHSPNNIKSRITPF